MDLDLSKRNTKGLVSLSIPAEDILRSLLGSRYNHIHGVQLDENRWKRILANLEKTLRKSIDANTETDAIHKAEIDRYLGIIHSAVNSQENTDPDILLTLVGICFELLGGLLDNRSKRIINNHPNNFRTNRMRSIHYTQSKVQKCRVIMRSALYEVFKKYYSKNRLESNFNGDTEKFIDWFKKMYPEAYAKLF